MLNRYVSHTATGSSPPVAQADERAYAATARFKQQLAERRRLADPTVELRRMTSSLLAPAPPG